MIYKVYNYSAKATIAANLFLFGSILVGGIGICFATSIASEPVKGILGIILIAAAIFLYVSTRKIPDKIAEEDFEKNIRTSVRLAVNYCSRNPAKFDEVCAINPEFAAKYTKNEKNRIVKIKNN